MRRDILSVFVLAASAVAVEAQQSAKVTLAPTSSVTVEGTSNVHNWKATSTSLTADIKISAPAAAGSTVEAVTVVIPVKSLKSGKGGLDKNLYKALRANQNPDIEFRMTGYKAEPKGDSYAAVVSGLLKVNGVEKEVLLDATITSDGKGGMRAVGSTKFKMTDFGVKPVTALLGTIKTGDAVTVTFDVSGATALVIAQLPEK